MALGFENLEEEAMKSCQKWQAFVVIACSIAWLWQMTENWVCFGFVKGVLVVLEDGILRRADILLSSSTFHFEDCFLV